MLPMLPDAFYHLKSLLNFLLPLSADALHVHVGLLLFIVALTLLKDRPERFAIAFVAVLAICLAGELLDLLYDYHAGNTIRWRNGLKDTVNTMLWPTIWTIVGMRKVWRKARSDARVAVDSPVGPEQLGSTSLRVASHR